MTSASRIHAQHQAWRRAPRWKRPSSGSTLGSHARLGLTIFALCVLAALEAPAIARRSFGESWSFGQVAAAASRSLGEAPGRAASAVKRRLNTEGWPHTHPDNPLEHFNEHDGSAGDHPHIHGPESHTHTLTGGAHGVNNCTSGGHGAAHTFVSGAFGPTVFFITTYSASAIMQQVSSAIPQTFRMPHSVNLFMTGFLMAHVSTVWPETEFGSAVGAFRNADPHMIFWVLLPALLYEDACAVNWHIMKKLLPSSLLLAIPGVIINAVLVAGAIKLFFQYEGWDWYTALLSGAILSATDPVAVVGALKSLAAPDKLSLLISGESLFNDGSAVVIFFLFWDACRGIQEFEIGHSLTFFARLAIGGPVLGFLVGTLGFFWMQKARHFNIEILVIIVCVYGLFFLSEHPVVKMSGVLAVVIFGFMMAARGRFTLSIGAEHKHHAIISFLALLSNEAIFMLAGVEGYQFTVLHQLEGGKDVKIDGRDWGELILLYFILHITRAMVILLFSPLLTRMGYGLNWKEALICVFGGLRGAVGLAMALLVAQDSRMEEKRRVLVAFHTSGIVILTLFVNGTLITPLYKRLKIYEKASHHDRLLVLALKETDEATKTRTLQFENHWFFHNCRFEEVMKLIPRFDEAAHAINTSTGNKALDHHKIHISQAKKTQQDVDDVLTFIAEKIGEEHRKHASPDARYAQKLKWAKKKGGNAENLFLNLGSQQGEQSANALGECVELALRMATEESQRMRLAAIEEAGEDAGADLIPMPLDTIMGSEGGSLDLSGEVQTRRMARRATAAGRKKTRKITGAASKAIQELTAPADTSRGTTEFANLGGRVANQFLVAAGNRGIVLDQFADFGIARTMPADTPEEKKERARYRWKVLHGRVMYAIQKLNKAQVQHQNLKKKVQQEADTSTRQKVRKEIAADASTMEELMQTVTNATRAAYKEMLEGRTLTEGPYQLLMTSLEYQEEAIAGALRPALIRHIMHDEVKHSLKNFHLKSTQENLGNAGHKQTSSTPAGHKAHRNDNADQAQPVKNKSSVGHGPNKLDVHEKAFVDDRLRNLANRDQDDQMRLCFAVAWQYLMSLLNTPRSSLYRILQRLVSYRRVWLQGEWRLLKRDVEITLAFVMTHEQILHDIDWLQSFEKQVREPMVKVLEMAKSTAMYKLLNHDPSMFALFEHILCARLIVLSQTHLLEEMVEEGFMTAEDFHHIEKDVLQPTVRALDRFTPNKTMLCEASATKTHHFVDSHWIFKILDFFDPLDAS